MTIQRWLFGPSIMTTEIFHFQPCLFKSSASVVVRLTTHYTHLTHIRALLLKILCNLNLVGSNLQDVAWLHFR